MPFQTRAFIRSLLLALLVIVLALAAITRFSGIEFWETQPDVAALVAEAETVLEEARGKPSGDRNSVDYLAIRLSLETLLDRARNLGGRMRISSPKSFEPVLELTAPVIRMSSEALALPDAMTSEEGMRLRKQKAEACLLRARAIWMQILSDREPVMVHHGQEEGGEEIAALLRVIDDGLAAEADNIDLRRIRAAVNNLSGRFADAVDDLQAILAVYPAESGNWNILGVLLTQLKRYDAADEALLQARRLVLARAAADKVKPGAEYATIVYNLARLHEGLTRQFARDNRLTPSADNQRLYVKHLAAARLYFTEFLELEPRKSTAAEMARRFLDELPE